MGGSGEEMSGGEGRAHCESDVSHLLHHVELAEQIEAVRHRALLHDGSVLGPHVRHVPQPVVNQAQAAAVERCADAAAAVVSTDDDVLDPQRVDGVLEDGEAVEVCVHHHVGHVAVDKELSGAQADDLVGRDAAVCASNPQIARGLLATQRRKEVRFLLGDFLGPGAVLVKELGDRAVGVTSVIHVVARHSPVVARRTAAASVAIDC